MISIEADGPVAVARMAHGKANALDTELCQEIVTRFGQLGRDGTRAVVLTGQGSVFSAGVDLLRVTEGGPAYLTEFMPALSAAFLAVFTCPVPVVAAVNGHAIAGGCVLVAACDHRVANAGRGRIGITELLVGVPFPPAALEIMRFAAGTRRLTQLTSFGRTYPAAEAAALGLVDEVVPEEEVLPRALAIAHELAALPVAALRHTREQIRGPVTERIRSQRAAGEAAIALWCEAGTLRSVSAYAGRVLHRG